MDSMADQSDKGKAPKPESPAPAPKTVNLRYLGSSHRLVDSYTGKIYLAGGDPVETSVEDVKRLESIPGEYFETVGGKS